MVAMLAMPRLPTPRAICAPGRTRAANSAAASCFLTSSATLGIWRSGNFCRTGRSLGNVILQEYIAAALHVHTASTEGYAFRPQPESLLQALVGRKQDFSARAHHPVPGQPFRRLQRPNHLSGGAFKACGSCHLAVGSNLAFGNPANGRVDLIEHGGRLIGLEARLLEQFAQFP